MNLVFWLLAILGALDLAGRGTHWLSVWFPRLLTLQSKAWRTLADSVAIPVVRRRAIATGIEEVVNRAVFTLQHHLPKGWIKRVRIQWVRNAKAAQFREGDIIIRIKPNPNPDTNLLQSLYTYFYSMLFPNCRDLLPEVVISGIALAITRGSIEHSHAYLLAEFDNHFVQTVGGNRPGVLEHFADCVRLNDYGFLMGPFVRELDYAASSARFSFERDAIPGMTEEIATHMLGFQPLIRINKPESEWYYEGACTAYGVLLVSKPREIRPGLDAYVKRGQLCVARGINRLYVIGRYEERDFVYAVLDALLTIRQLKGVEVFPLVRDYRGEPNGVGALLGLDQVLAKLHLTQRLLDRHELGPSEGLPHELQLEHAPSDTASVGTPEISKIVEDLIVGMAYYEGAWIPLAAFGAALRRKLPGFMPQRYGGETLTSVLRQLDRVEFDDRGGGSVYVRLRQHTQGDAHALQASGSNGVNARIVEVVRRHAHGDGWIFLGQLGHFLKHELPDFHHRNFGASSLGEFISAIPELETEKRGEGNLHTYVRVKK